MTATRSAPGLAAFALMVLFCLTWGFQQITIKAAMPEMPPLFQSGLRSLLALAALWGWAALRGMALWRADDTVRPGLLAGVLFALEFALIYYGLAWTSASRMIVFLYTGPCLTVLGLHACVPGERMRGIQFAGLGLAFAGIVIAFADGRGGHWLGDLCGLLAAVAWAATTVVIRGSALARITATRVLAYQLAVSAVLLLALAGVTGEARVGSVGPTLVLSLLYQGLIVAFLSYLGWFWLLNRYQAGRLMVFSFLTPLFGVAFGIGLLGDPLTPAFLGAIAAVLAGIVLVNWPGRPA